MSNLQVITGDLLESKTKYIAHQCNCKTRKFLGIAKSIFEKYPYSNSYIDGTKRIPGEIEIRGDGIDKRFVINLYGQLNPGKPEDYYFNPDNGEGDTERARLKWMVSCLKKVSKIENLESIAFPYKMGCNLAGGNWNYYQSLLEKFSEAIDAQVFIIKINGTKYND